jgi:hypothetical protein
MIKVMSANLHVPEVLAHRLERIAEQEGKSVNRLIEDESTQSVPTPGVPKRGEIRLPLIPAKGKSKIRPVTGLDLDELFALDDFIP